MLKINNFDLKIYFFLSQLFEILTMFIPLKILILMTTLKKDIAYEVFNFHFNLTEIVILLLLAFVIILLINIFLKKLLLKRNISIFTRDEETSKVIKSGTLYLISFILLAVFIVDYKFGLIILFFNLILKSIENKKKISFMFDFLIFILFGLLLIEFFLYEQRILIEYVVILASARLTMKKTSGLILRKEF